nr:CreA family protein [Pseudomonas meliae]
MRDRLSVEDQSKMVGPNDRIVVEAFDDPKVDGVTCYLSRAKTGGVRGGLGLAEDRAEASIACRQVGPIRFKETLKDGDEVFKERTSLVFKTMQVVRFFDKKRNALVYLVYSDRVIEGSPQNAVDSRARALMWLRGGRRASRTACRRGASHDS